MQPVTAVIIVGGSHSGLGAAKQIFKSLPDVKVTLISTSPDYFFNIASPRLLSRPKDVPLDQLLIPIETLFQKHPGSQFEFVHASVTELNPESKIISTDDGALRKYDYLIIASGSTFISSLQELHFLTGSLFINNADHIRQVILTAEMQTHVYHSNRPW